MHDAEGDKYLPIKTLCAPVHQALTSAAGSCAIQLLSECRRPGSNVLLQAE